MADWLRRACGDVQGTTLRLSQASFWRPSTVYWCKPDL